MGGNDFQRDIARRLEDSERQVARLRKLILPWFAPKRLKVVSGRIQELTDSCLDAMAAAHERNPAQAVNFHDVVGFRLPGLVICALLGVPDEDRDYVIGLPDRMGSTVDPADGMAAIAELRKYAARLFALKWHARGDDIVSYLLAAQESDPGPFSDSDLRYFAMGFVSPGHETMLAHIAFGHGPHYCIGQNLARTELRIVFGSLVARFTDIRLAVDVNELEIQNNRIDGGVAAVPVTW